MGWVIPSQHLFGCLGAQVESVASEDSSESSQVFFHWQLLCQECGSGQIVITLGIQSCSQMMIGMSNHLLSIVFRSHYHSQKVIGSLG